ncbi:MAG: DUF5329 domain-containing protein [Prevotellaceae bacterium]|jgi:hypothetical protein|nr:DUF5329 domain-containing protein [Prevotellaceae bacterium]
MEKILLFLFYVLPLCSPATAQALSKGPTEREKIERLIGAVEQLKEAAFIRGSRAYSAEKAAAHLRTKLRKAGDKIATAQDFIDGIASTSYLTGKPYYIRFKDGRQITSRKFFEEKLSEMTAASEKKVDS